MTFFVSELTRTTTEANRVTHNKQIVVVEAIATVSVSQSVSLLAYKQHSIF